MTNPGGNRVSATRGVNGVFGVIGGFVGLFVTQFQPAGGLALGIVAAVCAVIFLRVNRGLVRVAGWFAVGIVVGLGAYYLLALFALLSPIPGAGSGSGP